MRIDLSKPIDEVRGELYQKFKNDLYAFIVNDCNFPEWKQANYALRYSELGLKRIEGNLTSDELMELTVIESVIKWKSDLMLQKDALKDEIMTKSNTPSEVKYAIKGFVYTTPPVTL